jgi:hypothetical protein
VCNCVRSFSFLVVFRSLKKVADCSPPLSPLTSPNLLLVNLSFISSLGPFYHAIPSSQLLPARSLIDRFLLAPSTGCCSLLASSLSPPLFLRLLLRAHIFVFVYPPTVRTELPAGAAFQGWSAHHNATGAQYWRSISNYTAEWFEKAAPSSLLHRPVYCGSSSEYVLDFHEGKGNISR